MMDLSILLCSPGWKGSIAEHTPEEYCFLGSKEAWGCVMEDLRVVFQQLWLPGYINKLERPSQRFRRCNSPDCDGTEHIFLQSCSGRANQYSLRKASGEAPCMCLYCHILERERNDPRGGFYKHHILYFWCADSIFVQVPAEIGSRR